MTRLRRFLLLAAVVVASGCHHCGDRPVLFPRLRDRDADGIPDRREARESRDARDGCDTLPPPRSGSYGNPYGYPQSYGGGRFVSPMSGVPYSDPLPGGGFAPVPSYPYGAPIQIGPPARGDELPQPGSLISPPGVPTAPPRAIPSDTRMFPPLGGGMMTGDPKK